VDTQDTEEEMDILPALNVPDFSIRPETAADA
jgi:hypothetical protein